MKQNKISAFVREKRKEIGLTQTAMAREIGVGVRFYKELEMGKITLKMDKVCQTLEYFGAELLPIIVDPYKGYDPIDTIKINHMENDITDIDTLYDPTWEKSAMMIVRMLTISKKHRHDVLFYDGKSMFYEDDTPSKFENKEYYQSEDSYEKLFDIALKKSKNHEIDVVETWRLILMRWVVGVDNIRLKNVKNDKEIIVIKKEVYDTLPLSVNSKRYSIKRDDFIEAMMHTGLKEKEAISLIEENINEEKNIHNLLESVKISQEEKEKRKIHIRARMISLKNIF